MGNLLRSCVKVREPMELSFEVVSGVSRGMGVLEGFPHAPRGRGLGILFRTPLLWGRE